MADYDAIVVGAGHNGLAAASVLSKNGLRVLVVEKTNWPGGMAGTKELFKGYKHSVGAWALLIFREEMLKLLEFDRYGLELITPRTNYCVFGTPGAAPFIGYSDKAVMAEHLMKNHGPDAVQSLAGLVQYLQVFKGVMDPSLAPEGHYTCTFFSHYFPYDIPQGKHNEFQKVMADRMIDQMAKHAPNFRDAIVDDVVLTQQYFEKTFGITGGDFCQGLLHAGQMRDRRPVPGWSNYPTPIENLFMCGAACHPGPGVTGVPCYNSAHEVLKTWKG